MLRLGIIGCGRVTSMLHMKAIEQITEIRVTALSDVVEERMNNIKETCGANETYLDYLELIADPYVDAVAVNTPPLPSATSSPNTYIFSFLSISSRRA